MKQVLSDAASVARAAVGAVVLFTLAGMAQGCGTDVAPDATRDGAGETGCEAACRNVICSTGEACNCGTCESLGCIDEDDDGFGTGCEAGDDCDDTNPAVYPGREETCNDVDDDCDFTVDEGGVCLPCVPECEPGEVFCNSRTEIVYCDDSDGCPRIGEPVSCPAGEICLPTGCEPACQDNDDDGFGVDCDDGSLEDCDDDDNSAFPGNPEVCDGVDNNCDSRTDEGFVCDEACEDACEAVGTTCSADGARVVTCREGPAGCLVARAIACPPGSGCEGGSCTATATCYDPDGDGYGPACADDDCRPFDASVFPGATERCNGIDDDCDGVPDDGGVCAPCDDTRAFSLSVGEALYASTCGGVIEVTLTGFRPGEPVVALLGTDGDAPAFELGAGTGSTFATLATSGAVGTAQTAQVVPDDANLTVRFTIGAEPFVLTAASNFVDAYEPNGFPGAAVDVGQLPAAGGMEITRGDLDFLAIDPGLGTVVVVESVGADSAAPFPRIWAGNAEASWPFESDLGLHARTTHFRIDTPGNWSVGVRSGLASEFTPVAFRIREFTPPGCEDDEEDFGDSDDLFVNARPGLGTNSGVLCPGDYDIFDLGTRSAGGSLTIRLDGPDGVGFLLFRNGWSSIRYNSFSSAGGESTTLGLSDPGQWYVVVLGETPMNFGRYTLTTE